MMAAESAAASRAVSTDSAKGAGITVNTSLRAASGAASVLAQAISDDTPGTTSTGKRSTMRSNR